jgi:hypothetical protein
MILCAHVGKTEKRWVCSRHFHLPVGSNVGSNLYDPTKSLFFNLPRIKALLIKNI